jgi:predicted transposase YbfD/YdcC
MDMFDLEDCIITTDALNCQRNIAAKILSKKANYFLAVKGNHPSLYEDIKLYTDNKLELHKKILRPAGEDAKTQAFHANSAMCSHLLKMSCGQQGLKEGTIGAQ